jgi:putative transcriptional regulator
MRKYKSKIAAAVHEAMQDARDAGAIHKCTMRQFDESCLTRAEMLSAREIQRLRKREGVSQSVFARQLNVAAKLVGEWERGQKKPSGPPLKPLALVQAKGLDAIA